MSTIQACTLVAILSLAACAAETVGSEDSAGSTTAMSGSGTGSEAESETGEQDAGLCGGWSLSVELIGSMSMPGACEDLVFTGSLIEPSGASSWELDSCPCNADCDAIDPHTFSASFLGEGQPVLPAMPTCPQIELYRDAQCEIVSVVVRDVGLDSALVWWATRPDTLIPGFEWLINQLFDEQLCSDGDDDGPVEIGHAIRYAYDGASVELRPGESGTIQSTPVGTIQIHNGNASSRELEGEDVAPYPSYVVVVQ